MKDQEFGGHACLGIAPPQSNPVVEPEFSVLLPDGVSMLVTRLVGNRGDARQRFHQYLDNLETSLEAFGAAEIDAFGLAVTSTAYLFGDDEDNALDRASQRFGYPVTSAARAIGCALERLNATRIALFSPYPEWLTEASRTYWAGQGYDIVSWARVAADTADTLNIYRLRTAGLLDSMAVLETVNADAVLLTGTGMASLPALPALAERIGKPVLSSNLCLAWALLDELGLAGLAPPQHPGETLLGGWVPRLGRL
jgi:maleate isomerase